MPLGIIERFGGKVLAWSFALVLILALDRAPRGDR
jgi:hypothetical protein